jgi:TatD DNase family protein
MVFTDTHTHLFSDDFKPDLDALMDAAIYAGIHRFFMPNIDSTSIAALFDVENKYPGKCFPMMGLHPCSVKENWKQELELVEQWLDKRKFAAVGEMGIDLYWDKTFIEEQKIVFVRQVEMANDHKLPIVIHTRDSFDVAYELLQRTEKKEPYGIFHCFTGTVEQAQKVIDMGFYLGIGGVVTFKNGGLDKVLPSISMKNIVLETDAPYLAPVPHRGKRNEPLYLLQIAEKIAALKGISVAEVADITTENSRVIFEGIGSTKR